MRLKQPRGSEKKKLWPKREKKKLCVCVRSFQYFRWSVWKPLPRTDFNKSQ